MVAKPDTVYNHRPWESNEERLTTDALNAATQPAAMVRQIRPYLPQTELLPARFGYRPYEDRQTSIEDIMRLDVLYPAGRLDYSGRVSGYQGTSFPALTVF